MTNVRAEIYEIDNRKTVEKIKHNNLIFWKGKIKIMKK